MYAVVFPGQGAQYRGMGKDLYDNFKEARDVFLRADRTLGFGISELCFEADNADLKRTDIQQLAILTVSLAAYEVFKCSNIKIDLLSGLSLGEYTALYSASVIGIEDLVKLVRVRAEAMEEAARCNPSCMFAVLGVEKDTLNAYGKEAGFYIANLNAPGQVVISLRKEDRERIQLFLEEQGARVIELEVGGGFHSPFMQSAQRRLAPELESLEFKDAAIPIVSNFTATPATSAHCLKRNLIEQLVSPVLWQGCIEYMTSCGAAVFFEVGPSRILRGLICKINPKVKVINIEKKEDFANLAQELNRM